MLLLAFKAELSFPLVSFSRQSSKAHINEIEMWKQYPSGIPQRDLVTIIS